jgi:uncharacterized protein
MTIIFDTNTLLSAAIFPNSVSAKAFQKGLFIGEIIYSPEILVEIREVFSRPKFDKYVSASDRTRFLKDFIAAAIPINAQLFDIPICRDPKDEKFLELAVAANADFIITGDKDLTVLHPFGKTSIIGSGQFLNLAI